MAIDFWTMIIGTIGTFIGAFSGWFFTRRSQLAEAKGKELDNEIKLSDYYKEMLDDLSSRYEKKYSEIVNLYESKERILKDEIALLSRKITDLKKENIALRKRVKELEH